jgi:hypothetical protein
MRAVGLHSMSGGEKVDSGTRTNSNLSLVLFT